MNVLTGARVFGALVTIAVALWAIGREFRNAEWKDRFRRVMEERSELDAERPNLWLRYLNRARVNLEMLDKPYNSGKVTLQVISLFIVLFLATLALRYFFVIGILISAVIALFVYDRWLNSKANKRRDELNAAFLYEAVPVAVHVITATGKLDQAIRRMAQMVHNKPLKLRLQKLAESMNAPQFATPEDAFLYWSKGTGIRDVKYFAMATKEAKSYNVQLEELWLDMADLLGKDLEFKRSIKAQTSHHRTGGYVFYGMLAGTFLIAYPFGQKYMSETTKGAFWVVLGIMTLGLYLINRESQKIDA